MVLPGLVDPGVEQQQHEHRRPEEERDTRPQSWSSPRGSLDRGATRLGHSRSTWPCASPYLPSSSRKGTASKASGPSTPEPLHAPVASSSNATTGFSAVCRTTACAL